MTPRYQNGVRPNRGERGFAMLIVFMLAAAIALMLYAQMPRVAFESQRQKEQTLIDRGQQYTRAIQLYFIAFKKYPTKIEDLESTNNQRFLRRRFIDPMTGKNEWRLIHVNGAGQLTDSLVQKAPAPLGATGASGATGATGASGASGATGTEPPQVNAAVLRRPSDRPLTPQTGPGTVNPPSDDPDDPRNWPPIALVPVPPPGATGATGAPGAPGARANPGQVQPPQIPGQQFPNQFPNPGAGSIPGLPPGAQVGFQQPAIPGLNASPGQSTDPNAPSSSALNSINNMLTHPSQVGAGSAFNNSQPANGGLAGVASTFNAPSIKVYKDQQQYNKWEFIFDLKQGMPGQQPPQQQQPQQNSNPLGPSAPNPGAPGSTPGQIGPPPANSSAFQQ